MIEIPVYSADGKSSGNVEIDEALLGGQVRPALLKQAYVMYHANRRQGSAYTRSRNSVAGSTRKIYRQKGTGRARMGAVRSNIRRGGGVTFAKTPKDWRQSMPAKMRRLATRNALLSKINDSEIKLVDDYKIKAPKTKAFAAVLDALSVNRSCLVAVTDQDQTTSLSARNIEHVTVTRLDQLNAYDLLSHRFVVMDRATFEAYIQRLSPAVADVTGKPQTEEAA
jgi:large subunit ribosomal protein L4